MEWAAARREIEWRFYTSMRYGAGRGPGRRAEQSSALRFTVERKETTQNENMLYFSGLDEPQPRAGVANCFSWF